MKLDQHADYRFVVSGVLAGAVIGLLDSGLAWSAGLSTLSVLSFLQLNLLAGFLLSGGAWSVHRLKDLLPFKPTSKLLGAAWYGLVAGLLAVPLGRKAFSGAWIQTTFWGSVGPFLFPIVVAICATFLILLIRVADEKRKSPVYIGAVVFYFVIAVLALRADSLLYSGLYPYIHVCIALGALGFLAIAWGLLLPVRVPRQWMVVSLAAIVGSPFVLLFFPRNVDDKIFISEHYSVASRVVESLKWAVDFDRDGASIILGGEDCDDFDPAVAPHLPEIENNNRDENCDGSDYAKSRLRWDQIGYQVDLERARMLAGEAAKRPTVILLIDALRADRVGLERFPNLGRFAAQSVYFSNVFSPSSRTKFTIPAIAVGRPAPASTDKSVFERLLAKGVRTALVTIDYSLMVLKDTELAFDRGFAEIVSIPVDYQEDMWGGKIKTWTANRVTDLAFNLVDRADPPGLTWVHYFDLHQWSDLTMLKSKGTERYDETLELLDKELGRWLDRRHDLNILIISDHGEILEREGFEAHTKWLFPELVRVVFMMRIPNIAPVRVTTPVALTDMAPTLLDLYGILPSKHPWKKRSLLGVVGAHKSDSRPIPMFEQRHVSLVWGTRRLLHDIGTGATWLFDIENDPLEKINIAAKEPTREKDMTAQLRSMFSELSKPLRGGGHVDASQ